MSDVEPAFIAIGLWIAFLLGRLTGPRRDRTPEEVARRAREKSYAKWHAEQMRQIDREREKNDPSSNRPHKPVNLMP